MNQTTTVQWPFRSALALWVAIVIAVSVVLARIAVWLQAARFAAIGVFPAILGVACGAAVVWIGRWLQIRGRLAMIAGAVLAVLVIVAAEHLLFYLDYRTQFAAALQQNPKAQLAAALVAEQFQPASFYRFMAAEAPAKWPLWTADALAMIAVATIVAYFTSSPPHPLTSSPLQDSLRS